MTSINSDISGKGLSDEQLANIPCISKIFISFHLDILFKIFKDLQLLNKLLNKP